jgi:hypothetical protein
LLFISQRKEKKMGVDIRSVHVCRAYNQNEVIWIC